MNDFGELRSLLQRPHSAELWDTLCDLLEGFDATTLEQEVLPYALSYLSKWPANTRPMPESWHDRLLAHNDPSRFMGEDHPGLIGPYARAAGSLMLSGRHHSRPNDLRRIARSPFIGRLDSLMLEDLTTLREDVTELFESSAFDGLQSLTLHRTGFDVRRIVDLLYERPWPLVELSLRGTSLRSGSLVSALAEHPCNQTLEYLDLGVTGIQDDSIRALAYNLPPNLRELDLTCARASRAAVRELLDALLELSSFEHLSLFGVDVDPDDLAALEREGVTIPRNEHPSGVMIVSYDPGPRFGGEKFALIDSDTALVGRHPGADILVQHPTVSRRHATLTRVENSVFIEDSGSSSGIFVNRQRPDDARTLIAPDDVVFIGALVVTVDIQAPTF